MERLDLFLEKLDLYEFYENNRYELFYELKKLYIILTKKEKYEKLDFSLQKEKIKHIISKMNIDINYFKCKNRIELFIILKEMSINGHHFDKKCKMIEKIIKFD